MLVSVDTVGDSTLTIIIFPIVIVIYLGIEFLQRVYPWRKNVSGCRCRCHGRVFDLEGREEENRLVAARRRSLHLPE